MKWILQTLCLLLATHVFAQDLSIKSRPVAPSEKTLKLIYGNSAWNTSPKEIDSATLVFRDGRSQKTVLIQLQETDPDSSLFSGSYLINWGTTDDLIPEIYIPEQSLTKTEAGKKQLFSLIQSGKLPRKPFLLTRGDRGEQNLEIFDTRAQALKALDAHNEKIALKKQVKKLKDEDILNSSTVETAELAKKSKILKDLKIAALDREQNRLQLEQIEKQKSDERLKELEKFSAAEKQKRKDQAQDLANQALALFKKDKFSEAEEKYKQAVDLDPENHSYYYNYGVCLNRVEKYNESITILKLASDDNKDEKQYYLGINHFKLQEYDNATEYFQKVKNSQDPNLGPSAAFYLGIINFQHEKWNASKTQFEYVLDQSKDPGLDNQAEIYIENIQQEMQYSKMREKPFTANFVLGSIYDSNILFQPDNTNASAVATDKAGLRFLGGYSLEWKPIYTKTQEWSLKNVSSYVYSLSDDFVTADPFSFAIYAPYRYKGRAFDKGYKFELEPGIEYVYMDVDNTGTRGKILDTYSIKWNNTFVMRDDWYTSYNLWFSINKSHIDSATGDNDPSSKKWTLNYNNINFLSKKKDRLLISDVSFTFNDADGKDTAYKRLEASVSYVRPFQKTDITMIYKLGAYYSKYDDDNSRKDTNYNLTVSASKPLNEWLSLLASLGYIKNASSETVNEYSKYAATLLLNAKYNF